MYNYTCRIQSELPVDGIQGVDRHLWEMFGTMGNPIGKPIGKWENHSDF